MAKRFDPIGVVEAAYRLDVDTDGWLWSLIDAAAPDFPNPTTVAAYELVLDLDGPQDSVSLGAFRARGRNGEFFRENAAKILATIPAPLVRPLFVFGPPVASMADLVADGIMPEAALGLASAAFGDLGQDALWARALDRGGRVSFHVGATFESLRPTPPAQMATWRRLSAHLAAGYRLRRILGSGRDEPYEPDCIAGADGAILTPGGDAIDARGDARDRTALDRLRDAVVRREKAKSSLRVDAPGEALELWPALCEGRWSLVDCFERDGRRYVVARVNEDDVTDPRGLGATEQRVAVLMARGLANKEIAYELGLSTSRIGTLAASIRRKLGVDSRVEAIARIRLLLSRAK